MPDTLLGIATPADVPDICRFWDTARTVSYSKVAFGPALKTYISRNPFMCLVAEQSGRITATIVYDVQGRRGLLYHAAVESEPSCSGIFRELIDHALTMLAKRHCHRCHLFAYDGIDDPITREVISRATWQRTGPSAMYTCNL